MSSSLNITKPGDVLIPTGIPDPIAGYTLLEGQPFELRYDSLIYLDKSSQIIVLAKLEYVFSNPDFGAADVCLVLFSDGKFSWMFETSLLAVVKVVEV